MNTELTEILTGLKRALGLLGRSEQKTLVFATLLMAIVGLLTNLPAVIIGKLVDQMGSSPTFPFSKALPSIGLVLLILLIRESLTVARKLLVENVATQTEKKQTVKVIETLLKADITFISEQQIGSLHGRVLRSIQGLIRIIKLSFLEFLPVFFAALAAIGLALYQKPLLGFVMVLVIPSGLFLIIKQISSQKGIRVTLLRGKEKIDGTVVEMLGGLETIRVADTTSQEVAKVASVAESLRIKEIRHHLSMALFDAGKHINEGFSYVLVVGLAILLSTQGVITKGDVLVYSILFLSISAPLREIHRTLDHAHESSILVNDLHDLLNQPPDITFNTEMEQLPSPTNNHPLALEISNLSFAYPGKSKVLDGVSLEVIKGEKIGIVGTSGGGKSTFIKILLRLIHGYLGKVYLFGQDLNTITHEHLAKKIAYVPQKTYIFSGTIKENIIYGVKRKVSNQEVILAAKRACLSDEISTSLGGLEGRVTENGGNLSGGQKQRLAIARLILRSPDILIFDEATSALDNTNEAQIQKNLFTQFRDQTMIIIAHRLTTLKNCDRVLVLDQGKIVQEGTFTKLAQDKGLFQTFLQEGGLRAQL